MAVSATLTRHQLVRRGEKLEYFTVGWNSLEGLVVTWRAEATSGLTLEGVALSFHFDYRSRSGALLCDPAAWLREWSAAFPALRRNSTGPAF